MLYALRTQFEVHPFLTLVRRSLYDIPVHVRHVHFLCCIIILVQFLARLKRLKRKDNQIPAKRPEVRVGRPI